MTLGEFLKNKRIEKNLSMLELAKLAKISNWQNIQKWEKNLSEPSATNIFKLIKALNLNINELENILIQDN